MNGFFKKRKWLKGILIVLLLLLTLIAGAYYTILFRFKEAIQYIVKSESKDAYFFDAASIKVSLFKGSIHIKKAIFTSKDTMHAASHYDVHMPNAYFQVASWRDILFKRKIIIDSLTIDMPQFKVHEHTPHVRSHVSFHISSIFTNLQKARSYLEIRSFTLDNAAFNYGSRHQPANFNSNRINFSIKNFSNAKGADKKFLSADDIDLTIADQHWKLPDGRHELNFSKLHFSGKNQFFEVDSCTFSGKDAEDKFFSISIDRLFFNSSQLSSFYNKEELILDSVILFHPVLTLPPAKKDKPAQDTTQLISRSFRDMFKMINLKYIDIRDGHVELSRSDTIRHAFSSYGTDLKIYNLKIRDDTNQVSTDSIVLAQKGIEFITKDSLFKLTIGEFYIRDNNLLLKDASYGPTEFNHNVKSMTFKAPLLALHEISVEDLISKRLRAKDAQLINPEITFTNSRRLSKKLKPVVSAATKAATRDKFYTTLHGISELIAVEEFRIQNGNLTYDAAGPSPLKARMEKLDILILLNKFFSSDSLVDIKRSLPEVAIERISIASPRLKLHIKDFGFQGEYRHNHAGLFQLNLINGTELTGKDLSWVIFDWDRFQRNQSIFINTISAREMLVHFKTGTEKNSRHVAKDLPVIHIDRADIGKLQFKQSGSQTDLHFEGGDICLENVNSSKRVLLWTNATALLNNIVLAKPGMKARIGKINFNTDAETTLDKASIELTSNRSGTRIEVPSVKLGISLHSSDFSSIHLRSVAVYNPLVEVIKKIASTNSTTNNAPVKKPMLVVVDKFLVNNAQLKYLDISGKDSAAAGFNISMQAMGLMHDNNTTNLLTYKKADIDITKLQYQKNTVVALLPKLYLHSDEGIVSKQKARPGFKAAVLVEWADASVQLKKTDSTGIFADQLSGSFSNKTFAIIPGTKIRWQDLVKYSTISDGNMYYKGKEISAEATAFKWDASHRNVSIGAFKVMPHLDEAAFYKSKGWQADYITLKGSGVNINDIRLGRNVGDSTLLLRKLMINGVVMTTLKDKRYPFIHGKEKQMFARLINKIKYPLHVDTVQLQDATITVNEITEKSHKRAIIPLENVNAVITHVTNKNNGKDSLQLSANLQLFDIDLHHLNYREAYADSLGGFSMHLRASPIVLPRLSALTIPFADVRITNGLADTLFANWYGNKYAAAGTMHLYYNGLKIKLLNKKDSTKRGFMQRVGGALANDIALHRHNSKPSYIFFVRDREKSVFNFWVKSLMNGAVGGAAIFQNKKHYRAYKKQKDLYKLPQFTFDQPAK